MLDGLKPYSEYKNSTHPWLGAVPTHWHIERLDRLFRLRSEWPVEGDQRVTGYLDGRVTLRSNVIGQKIKGVVKEAGWQRVHPGDFAISGMNAHLGGMGVSDSLGKCSPIYLVLIPKPDTNAAFVSRAVRHIAHSNALKVLVSTIRFNSADFKRDHLKLIWVQTPSADEQTAIVRFLGAVDRRVNRFIRAKRRLIEVLTEQKQAIITHVVTRGLNPHAPLKPSGIGSLGDIPEHWEVIDLRYLATKFGSGVTPKGGSLVYQAAGVPFLRSQNVHFSGLRLDKVAYITPSLHASLKATHVQPRDVLLNITGASIGRVCHVPADFTEGNVNQHVCIIRPRLAKVVPSYLASFLSIQAAQTEMYLSQNGSSREGLTLQAIRDLSVILPPRPEQLAIVAAISDRTCDVDAVIDRTECEIDLIREYRTRLVADVVTGKVDVRAAAAFIPTEEEANGLPPENQDDPAAEDEDVEDAPAGDAEEVEA